MIPNGCDLELFASETADKTALRVGEAGKFTAMFTGAHGIANGLDTVLDAAHQLLRRSRDDIQLVFLGNGKLKPLLQQRAHDDALANCVFLDPVPKTTLAQLMTRVDAGLMILANVPAFYYGTSPNKFFDYIAAGLPVVINYPGWLADIITESQCGVVIPPGDPAAFADSLEFLADHPDERKKMRHHARVLAERRFDRNCLAAQFVDWIERVMGGKIDETRA